ncbi:MAG: thiamine pyrophosphokinae, catalytic region [Clostridia bacterium]|jgi:uncharacterized membrane-anchored protein|nr:thiamine pyrophosphokinae, catalytic region [Clostridia bacterium]
MYLEGIVKIGAKTKELVKYLSPSDIAVIKHDDIDDLAAEALIDTGVRVVINTGKSMTGRYYSKGAGLLLANNIYLFDTGLDLCTFRDGDYVKIRGKDLIINNNNLHTNSCTPVNKEYIDQKLLQSKDNYSLELSGFIDNTIQYASQDKESILNFADYPDLGISIRGRCALIVVRNTDSKSCLVSLNEYIEREKPVLIGVDGGADIIISCGYTPDILIGDMDSVSDVGIFRSRELILHSYKDGRCPCLKRIEALNIKYKLLPMTGTSEDIALLLAYDKGASNIILIGGHNVMTDFLERGRAGMGSTLITRFKVSDRLIDYSNYMKMHCLVDNKPRETYSKVEDELLWMKM